MLVDKSRWKLAVTDLLMIAAAVCYVIGNYKWFPTCAAMGENYMSCHWAGEMLKAIALLILIISIIHMLLPDEKMKIGMDIALIGLYIMTVFVPGKIIHICSDPMMSCRKATLPCTIGFCVLLILLALSDIICYLAKLSRDRHKRE